MKSYRKKNKILLVLGILFLLLNSFEGIAQTISKVKNSVTVTTLTEKITDVSAIREENSISTVSYSDGLGRTHMSVEKKVTPSGKDLVSAVSYGVEGEIKESWLPVALNSEILPLTGDAFKAAARDFYGDTAPYSSRQRNYDNIYVESVTGPGKDWHNNNKKKTALKSYNQAQGGDSMWVVRRYSCVNGNAMKLTGTYPQGALQGTYLEDEDGKTSLSFYDAQGKLILERKVYNENRNEYYDTYHVYEERGLLAYVLPPEASLRLNSLNTTIPINKGSVIDLYCYVYSYDELGMCISKKLPGAESIEYIYDRAGRLVLVRDGEQRSKKEWSFILYDKYGRVVQEGIIKSNQSDDTEYRHYYSSHDATETWTSSGYTKTNTFSVPDSHRVVNKTNYYDDYSFIDLSTYSTIRSQLTYLANNNYGLKGVRIENGVDISTRGMQTGVETKLLDGPASTVEAFYYDEKGRVVQVKAKNHLNGTALTRYAYNFDNTVAKQYKSQRHPSRSSNSYIIYAHNYDKTGRLTATYQQVLNSLETYKVKIDSLEYDELGRVKKKGLQNNGYSINYRYNIRGQLTSISSPFFKQNISYQYNNVPKYYNGNISSIEEEVRNKPGNDGYNYSYVTFSYDGVNRLTTANLNVCCLTPQGSDYSTHYRYDRNGNITFLERLGPYETLINPSGGISYGIIDGLGMKYHGNQLIQVDDYADNHTIESVGNADFKENYQSLPDGQSSQYLYNRNGSLKADHHKKIAWVQYNSLNLPSKIQMSNGDKTEYLYDASGVKLQSKHVIALNSMQIPLGNETLENTNNIHSTMTRDYLGDFIFENGSTKRILMPDGYIEVIGSVANNWKRVYQIKDHLGNVRLEINTDKLASNTNSYSFRSSKSYYPFGMEMSFEGLNNSALPYQVSGNELERTNTNWHDFHHRWYDQQLGRFLTMDPLAELDYSISPYAYCNNNPMNLIDPWGLTPMEGNLPEVVIEAEKPKKKEDKPDYARFSNFTGFPENGDNSAPERFPPGFSQEAKDNNKEELFNKALEEDGIKPGDQVMEPLSGFWDNFFDFLSMRTYFDGNNTWLVDKDGKILFLAYKTGSPDLIGGLGKGTLKGGSKMLQEIKKARALYPKKAGKTELHHITPRYLGGPKSGEVVPLDGAYHQVITNEFRRLHGYGKELPLSNEADLIMKKVYSKYPLK